MIFYPPSPTGSKLRRKILRAKARIMWWPYRIRSKIRRRYLVRQARRRIIAEYKAGGQSWI